MGTVNEIFADLHAQGAADKIMETAAVEAYGTLYESSAALGVDKRSILCKAAAVTRTPAILLLRAWGHLEDLRA